MRCTALPASVPQAAGAELTVVENLSDYANAVANLRFVTGTLLPSRGDDLYAFDIDALLRLPPLEESSPADP
jgi:hypothetical protein